MRTSDALTVVITTSVTPSSPSTILLSSILESFHQHCKDLAGCRVILVFDGYDRIAPQARLKKGQVTPDQANCYALYKGKSKKLFLSEHYEDAEVTLTVTEGQAEYGSEHKGQNVVNFTTSQTQDKKITFIEPQQRLGFGLAVRTALRMVDTPYVWVQQHDWALVSEFPVQSLLQIMQHHKLNEDIPIKYVCLPAVRMLSYTTCADVVEYPKLKSLTATLKGNFVPELQPDVKIPLTPLFFWHDKPHIACTAHYLARVFPTRLAMLRGDFIEDKVGQRARAQMKEGLVSIFPTMVPPIETSKAWSLHFIPHLPLADIFISKCTQ